MSYNVKTETDRNIIAGNANPSEISRLDGEITSVKQSLTTLSENVKNIGTFGTNYIQASSIGTYTIPNGRTFSSFRFIYIAIVGTHSGENYVLQPTMIPINGFDKTRKYVVSYNDGAVTSIQIKYTSETQINISSISNGRGFSSFSVYVTFVD